MIKRVSASLLQVRTMNIRIYEDRDFENVWRLFHRLTLDYGIGDMPTEQQSREHVRTNILGADSDVRVVLALDGSNPIGLACFSIMYPVPRRTAQLYMKELFVDVERRGQGIGLAIMRFLANYALSHNCSRFDWATETANAKAMSFYKSIGATPLKEKAYFRLTGSELDQFSSGIALDE